MVVTLLIISHIVSFVAGALIFRNNSKAVNADISTAESVASTVKSAATTVASDVKKA